MTAAEVEELELLLEQAYPHKPRLLHLPAGQGTELDHAMTRLVEELRTALASALESEEYQSRRQVIEDEFKERPAQALATDRLIPDAGSQLGKTRESISLQRLKPGQWWWD